MERERTLREPNITRGLPPTREEEMAEASRLRAKRKLVEIKLHKAADNILRRVTGAEMDGVVHLSEEGLENAWWDIERMKGGLKDQGLDEKKLRDERAGHTYAQRVIEEFRTRGMGEDARKKTVTDLRKTERPSRERNYWKEDTAARYQKDDVLKEHGLSKLERDIRLGIGDIEERNLAFMEAFPKAYKEALGKGDVTRARGLWMAREEVKNDIKRRKDKRMSILPES